MAFNTQTEDKGMYRRKFPRRAMRRKVGVLVQGTYFICESGEIGEGGMSIMSELILDEGSQVVVSFQIPNGGFVNLRAIVKTVGKAQPGDRVVQHGLSFSNIEFSMKRQIRAFVSART